MLSRYDADLDRGCQPENISKGLALSLSEQKEEIIREAITHKVGRKWSLADLARHGEFRMTPDGVETFSFNGEDLVRFFEPSVALSVDTATAYLNYKILYNEEK